MRRGSKEQTYIDPSSSFRRRLVRGAEQSGGSDNRETGSLKLSSCTMDKNLLDEEEVENYAKFQNTENSPADEDADEGGDSDQYFEMALLNAEKSHLLDESSATEESVEIKLRDEETFTSIFISVFIPFLIAGIGMVGAGLVLDIVQHWEVFVEVREIYILVPALLGLKGNLEMTLASRLSTQANLGNMDSAKSQWRMSVANLSLVQCQGIVVGFLASLAAMLLGYVNERRFDYSHALLLCTSSVVTASVASFALGVIMVFVIVLSRYCNINPDNVATPIAASLGDLTTLSLLTCVANTVFENIENHPWIPYIILFVYLISMPFWIFLTGKHKQTREVLSTGWTPVLAAMVISSCGGLILNMAVKTFKGIAVFQPVINGVGGNLVAVQASRISTSFHFESELGKLPEGEKQMCADPVGVFCAKGGHAKTARALLLMVVPGHLIFCYTISYVKAGHTTITPIFLSIYMIAALAQVVVLLYIADVLIRYLWVQEIDPDNSAIPYLTALGDLIGTAFLALGFYLLWAIGDKDADVGD